MPEYPASSTRGQLQQEVPHGTVLMYAAAEVPKGWLKCDGAAVKRSQYRILFGLIGTTYGVGDGSTTFNLPNFTSKFPRGGTVGATGGDVSHDHGGVTGISSNVTAVAAGAINVSNANHAHTLNVASSLPPYLNLTFIIKAA